MATAAPEDHEEIRELQANLRRVLADWDAAGPGERDDVFTDRLVPAADDLVAARQQQVQRRADIKASRVRDWAGRIMLVAAVLVVVLLLLFGANPWWALCAAPLLAAGLYLQIPGRNRA